MLTLAAIYRERRDWLKARQLLGRAAATSQDLDERVRLLIEAAEICANQLDDENQAAEILRRRAVARSDAHRSSSTSWRRSGFAAATGPACCRSRSTWWPSSAPALGVPDKPADERARLWYQLGARRRGDRRPAARGGGVTEALRRGARRPADAGARGAISRRCVPPGAVGGGGGRVRVAAGDPRRGAEAARSAGGAGAHRHRAHARGRAGEGDRAAGEGADAGAAPARRARGARRGGQGGRRRRRRRPPHAGAAVRHRGSQDEARAARARRRRFTTSGARIRSARSRPTWRRWRSGRTSGRSCTACSSC